MSDPSHREVLPDFVLGWLDGDPAGAEIEAALADDPQLRAEAAAWTEVMARLALAAPPVEVPASLRVRLQSETRAPGTRFLPFLERLVGLFHLGADTVRELLAKIDDPASWEWMQPGCGLMHLPTAPATAGADVGFVWLEAGHRFTAHTHLGAERTLVLQGGYRDEDGTIYRAGDTISDTPGTTHWFDALDEGEDLIYAVVVWGVEFHPELTPPKQ